MKNKIFVCFIGLVLPGLMMGQLFKGQVPNSTVAFPAAHYQNEYTADVTINPEAWGKEKKGMQVSFVSTDESWFRSEAPGLQSPSLSWEGTGWKGERLNAEVLVWSTDTLQQVKFVLKDLHSNKGKIISASNIRVNMVRYVIGNAPYGAKDVTCGGSPYHDLYLMPDRFEAFDRFDLPGKTVRPVWLSFDIPADAAAGVYNGVIEVRAMGAATTLHVKIYIQHQGLPAPHQWAYRLDLWQNPWVIANTNHIKPWSAEHLVLLKKHLQLYAGAGGKYITTYAVNSPWSDNSYATEGGMINWEKRTDGSWKFDYRIFDTYVKLAMSMGIDKAITIYTPVPGGYRFYYMDEKTGNMVEVSLPPASAEFKEVWEIFLTDLKKHLEQKGWFEKTYIGINENPVAETLAAIKVVRENSVKWKITYAGDWHPELENLLNDYCFVYGHEPGVDVVKQRASKGFTTTWYVCCTPAIPNNFVFSPPAEGRWQGWYSVAHQYSGFLRWAYDAWPADPSRDARHGQWPAGDCYLVYPGGNSCVRFEKLREGIVDYEKIRILRAEAASSTNKEVDDLMKQLDSHLQVFLAEKDFNSAKIIADMEKGKSLVEKLSDKLYTKQIAGQPNNYLKRR